MSSLLHVMTVSSGLLCVYNPAPWQILSQPLGQTPSTKNRVRPAGFWGGLWHGIIAPIAFLVSLFVDGVSIYESNNNGRWYRLGFMLGIGAYAGNEGARRAAGG